MVNQRDAERSGEDGAEDDVPLGRRPVATAAGAKAESSMSTRRPVRSTSERSRTGESDDPEDLGEETGGSDTRRNDVKGADARVSETGSDRPASSSGGRADRDRPGGARTTKREPDKREPEPTESSPSPAPDVPPPVGLLGAMWRFKGMCLLIVVATVAISIGLGFLFAPQPSATATIALRTPGQDNVLSPGATGDASLSRYTAQRARFASSDAVLENVGAALGERDLNALRDNLEITPSTDSNIITITASASTGGGAVELASEVARAYGEETEKQVGALTDAALDSIEESADEVRSTITSNNIAVNDAAASTLGQLQQRASSLRSNSALLGNGVEFVVKPDATSVKTTTFPYKEAALGLVIGLVLAGTVAFLRAETQSNTGRPD